MTHHKSRTPSNTHGAIAAPRVRRDGDNAQASMQAASVTHTGMRGHSCGIERGLPVPLAAASPESNPHGSAHAIKQHCINIWRFLVVATGRQTSSVRLDCLRASHTLADASWEQSFKRELANPAWSDR
jgi:hypothetical protein